MYERIFDEIPAKNTVQHRVYIFRERGLYISIHGSGQPVYVLPLHHGGGMGVL